MEFGDKVCERGRRNGGKLQAALKKKKKASGWKVNCMSHVFLRGWFSNRLVFCFVFCVLLFRPPSEFLLREGRLTSERKEATEGEDTLLAVRDCSFSLR